MTLARTDTFDQRNAIFAGLATRNRLIAVLRMLVPAAGVVAFLVLAAEIYVTNTLRQYGISGIRIDRGTLVVADIVEMPQINSEQFDLILAMGDPLSICSDPQRAAREFHRICKPAGIVIATTDNKFAAIDHYVERGNLDALEQFIQTARTQ